nr:hypothetical protein [Tanacetum cinerariifolium]
RPPQRNRSRPVRYANGASDDSVRPNNKMKMKKIKVTPKKKVDEYTPPYFAHPQRNQSRPVRYVNDASDDSDRPNKKMKRMIKVTPKKKVDEYTPPYLTKRIKQDPVPVGPTHQAI